MPFLINLMKSLDPPEDAYTKYMIIQEFPNLDKFT